MKRDPIEVFVPTGEVRRPKKGEWIKSTLTNDFIFVRVDFTFDKYPIYTRTEIPIPEGSEHLACYFRGMDHSRFSGLIPLPSLKKPKVKKWIGFFNREGSMCLRGVGMVPTLFNTKEEALSANYGYNAVEIEVEEP
jgi:hypothetical protein